MENRVLSVYIRVFCLGISAKEYHLISGWHHKLNTTVRYGGCSIYVLVPTLMTEAEIVAITVAADDLDRDVETKAPSWRKRYNPCGTNTWGME
ncbi:hypothetical protein DPMN_180850 [Dreissena polymorpha]|uniref:Uncharacterized protein n=1 Tax=Dreissena polymorpha TaxID=45954 RepID=A0A9D4I4R6_DREPO|nr:hypothetical protein DPMN_180850 [Dreissena polymorpha]